MTDPELEPEEVARPRVSARSVAIWGARATGGLVGVGVAAVVAIAALLIVPPTWSATPPEVVVQPAPAAQVLVCPGSLLRLADDTGQNASDATPIGGVPTVRFTAGSGQLSRGVIGQSDAGTGGSGRAPQLGLVNPVDRQAPVVAGMQSSRIPAAEGNVVGYVAASCQQPNLRSWIVGGSTQLGRTSILTLVNPTNVEAVVDLRLYGEAGPIAAAGLQDIVVPANAQRVIPVNGFALGQRAPMIGVESSGGNVVAFLQESIIRTLTPGGVDLTGQQSPSSTLVIPGVLVAGETALAPINTTELDHDDTMPTLRLLTTGASTDVTVAFIPEGATLAEALENERVEEFDAATDAHIEAPTSPEAMSFRTSLEAGLVAELPVPGIAAGEYTVVVLAGEPVVGALRASITSQAGTDFAWYSPAGSLGEDVVVATPDAPEVVLAIANDGPAGRTVVLGGPDGEESLIVPAGSTTLVEVDPRADYALSGMTGLRAAIRAGGAGLVAQTPLQPPAPLATPVRVFV